MGFRQVRRWFDREVTWSLIPRPNAIVPLPFGQYQWILQKSGALESYDSNYKSTVFSSALLLLYISSISKTPVSSNFSRLLSLLPLTICFIHSNCGSLLREKKPGTCRLLHSVTPTWMDATAVYKKSRRNFKATALSASVLSADC